MLPAWELSADLQATTHDRAMESPEGLDDLFPAMKSLESEASGSDLR